MRTTSIGLLWVLLLGTSGCGDDSSDPQGGGGQSTGGAGGSGGSGGQPEGGAGAGTGAATVDGGSGGTGAGGSEPACAVDWAVQLNEGIATSLSSSAVLPGGDVVVAGHTSTVPNFFNNSGFYAQPMAVRLTPDGQEVWRTVLPATGEATVRAMVTGPDGTVYLAGHFSGDLSAAGSTLTAAGVDVFLAALDADGVPLWLRQAGDGEPQRAKELAIDASGDLVLGGEFYGTIDFGGGPLTATLGPDIFIARLTQDGEHIASRTIEKAEFDSLYSLDVALDGRVFIGAEHFENLMGAGFVAAYSSDLSTELFSNEPAGFEPQVRAEPDGTVVILDYTLRLRRLDASGSVLNTVQYDAGDASLTGPRVAVTPDGLVCVTGTAQGDVDLGSGPISTDNDAVLACYDADWLPQFTMVFGSGVGSLTGRYHPLGPGSGVVSGIYAGGITTCAGDLVSSGMPDAFAARVSY